MQRPRRVLILGGTGEALALANALLLQFGNNLEVTTSLAGRTHTPSLAPGAARIGGFGGSEGLAAFLTEGSCDLVIDATHPFAARISSHARTACDSTGTPRLTLARPPWSPTAGDRWYPVRDAAAAAALLPSLGQRAFLTIGARDLGSFSPLTESWFLVRLIEQPPAPLPLSQHHLITARGPFGLAGELALMHEHTINVLVSKASGGDATRAKIDAARTLGLPVILLERPPPEPGPSVDSVGAAVAWVAEQLDLDAAAQHADH